MAVVTPTDRPESALNRCVIEIGGVLCCPVAFWIFQWVYGAFVIGLSQTSSYFLDDDKLIERLLCTIVFNESIQLKIEITVLYYDAYSRKALVER